MEVVKPKRSAEAEKTWGTQETGDYTRSRSFIDHLGRLVLMSPQTYFDGPAPEDPERYMPRPPRISRGRLLVESAKSNWFYYPQSLHMSWWLTSNLAITSQADVGPEYGVGAIARMTGLAATTTNGVHKIQGTSVNGLPAGQATVSFVVKRKGTGTGSRYISLNSVSGSVGFDLQTGAKTNRTGIPDGSIEPLYNGSFLVSMTYTHASGNASPSMSLRSTSGAGEQSFAGNNSDGVFAGFAQLESGTLSSFIPEAFSGFTAIAGYRAADMLVAPTSLPVLGSSEAIRPGVMQMEWRPDGFYNALQRVVRYGVEYESLLNSNYGHDPVSNPTWWRRIGAANSWAMFDELLSSTTTAEGTLDVALWLQESTTLVLMGLKDVDTVRVSLSSGPGADVDWIQTSIVTGKRQAVIELPGGSALAEVRLSNALGATLQVGNVAWGSKQTLGEVRYGARAGIRDYSRKETNEFGETVFVRRAFAKTLTCTLEVQKADLAQVQLDLEDLRATPALWIGSSDPNFSQTLVVYGFYRDFYVSVDYPNKSLCSLELEGLI